MKINIDTRELDRVRRGIADFSERRLKSVVATALTRTAAGLRKDWTTKLRDNLDRPTPRTQGAAGIQMARADRLEASVFLKDNLAGTSPTKYLAPQEYGGPRGIKKFERALVASGAMPDGYLTVPAGGAVRDSYGNVSRAQLVAVIRALGQQYSPGYQQVISRSTSNRLASQARHGRRYIAIQPGAQAGRVRVTPGIYERMSDRGLKAIFIFKNDLAYKRRLRLVDRESMAKVTSDLQVQVDRAMSESLARLSQRNSV